MDPPTSPTVSQPVIQETVDTSSTSVASVDEDDDDTLDYFSKLAEEN